MIVVDTNVVSEALRAAPDRKVIAWLDAQPIETLFLPAISYAELMLGVRQLPLGKRRTAIAESLDRVLSELFGDRTLPFDLAAAKPMPTSSPTPGSRALRCRSPMPRSPALRNAAISGSLRATAPSHMPA